MSHIIQKPISFVKVGIVKVLLKSPEKISLLPNYLRVYQMSTKKAWESLRRRGSQAFPISGRLPDVYQFYFLTQKQSVLTDFLPIFIRSNRLLGA